MRWVRSWTSLVRLPSKTFLRFRRDRADSRFMANRFSRRMTVLVLLVLLLLWLLLLWLWLLLLLLFEFPFEFPFEFELFDNEEVG